MNECQDNSEFFPHSKRAIDTQRDYIKLAGTIYSCQMVVMPLAICIPPGLVRVFAGVSAGLARAAALRGERRRMRKQGEGWCKAWCLAERGEIPSSLALLESLCSLYVFR